MREIKFRCWHKTEKSMLKPDDKYGTTRDLDCVVYYMQGQPVELMQYTGLKDKNGKEVYEGDIVRVAHDAYESPICVISIKNLVAGDFMLDEAEVKEAEVIGNIYQNPALLKGE